MPSPIASLPSLQPPGEPKLEAVRKAAEDFEAVFLGQMLSGMAVGVKSDGPLGGGDDPFAAMLRDEYAKLISRKGGIGIAEAVVRQLVKMQEGR